MKGKTGLKIALALTLFAAMGLAVTANYLTDFAIGRRQDIPVDMIPKSAGKPEAQTLMENNKRKLSAQREKWLSLAAAEPAEITSRDGLKLKGEILRINNESHRWLLTVHGYMGNRRDMRSIAAYYGEKGYHVLMPDLRAHGESEGDYIGMGWLDRTDLQDWISYLLKLDPRAKIVLHGISMGGAAVMMAAGDGLPYQVKGIVEDCGYTSVRDIFSDELKALFHLPDFPILPIASAISRLKAGYSFGEASALEQIKKCSVPVLFIHGSEDRLVHTEMAYRLYEACPAPKDLLVVEGAGHGASYVMAPDEYFQKISAFLEEHCF